MNKSAKKLVLNQETLRNLTADQLKNVFGGTAINTCICPTTTNAPTCVECNPPDTTGM